MIFLYIWIFGYGLSVIKGQINAMGRGSHLPIGAWLILIVLWPLVIFLPIKNKK